MNEDEWTYNLSADLDLEEAVFQALGSASMCWVPQPRGVLLNEYVKTIGNELVRYIRANLENAPRQAEREGSDGWNLNEVAGVGEPWGGHVEPGVTFRQDLQKLINVHSMENRSNTPDWILTEYLMKCLEAWELGTTLREEHYGREG